EDAAALRAKMFSFMDIGTLSLKARSVLFDKVASEQIVLALRGTDLAFRDGVLSAVGARARRLIENELTNGSATPKEIAAARKAISNLVLELIGRGEIELDVDPDTAT
ncbi:MAG TPA: FliG C-terminal domain-containing protein, partial [Bradyrhizobium sp.]